jgi:hypothetical protein
MRKLLIFVLYLVIGNYLIFLAIKEISNFETAILFVFALIYTDMEKNK